MAHPDFQKFLLSDPTIGEVYRVNNKRQGIKNLDKKIKKSPKDLRALVTKAYLLHELDELEACAELCDKILELHVPLGDIILVRLLSFIFITLGRCDPQRYAGHADRLWLTYVEAQGRNDDAKIKIMKEWAHESIMQQRWGSVVKASSHLYKVLPETGITRKKYHYWRIVAHWLSKPVNIVTDQRAHNLGPQLALRLMNSAISETPASADSILSSTSVISKMHHWPSQRQDFDLMNRILYRAAEHESILRAINEKRLGLQFPPGLDYWEAHYRRCLALLCLNRGDEAAPLAYSVLKEALDLGLRWKVEHFSLWTHFVQLLNLTNSERVQTIFDRLIHEVGAKFSLRSAQKAALHDHFNRRPQICPTTYWEYFRDHCDELICFTDLKAVIRSIKPEYLASRVRQKDIQVMEPYKQSQQTEVDKAKWIVRELNSLRMDLFSLHPYCLPGKDENESNHYGPAILKEFVCTCVRAYKCSQASEIRIAETDVDPSEGFILLAVRALTHLGSISHANAVKAACLLNTLLGKPNGISRQAKLTFVHLCMALGLYSLAIQTYETIQVKEILIDSCSLFLFNQIAFSHPFECGSFRPCDELDKALAFYTDALRKVPKTQSIALEAENYRCALDLDEFASQLRNSPTRRMLLFERERIGRITGLSPSVKTTGMDSFPPDDLIQPKDDKTPVQFISDLTLFIQPPLNFQALLKEHHETIWELVEVESPNVVISKLVVERSKKISKVLKDDKMTCQMTNSEIDFYETIQILGDIFFCIRFLPSGQSSETLKRHLEGIRKVLSQYLERNRESLEDITAEFDNQPFIPWATFLCYSEYDVLFACFEMAGRVLDNLSHPAFGAGNKVGISVKAKAIQRTVKERLKFLKSTVKELIDLLNEMKANGEVVNWVIGDSAKGEIGAEILDLVGYDDVMLSVDSFIESAKEGLSGVLRLELPEVHP